ncbi:hypothetical protein [Actibacterium sp. 188UL27-1]|uniref:hypothetical protein n=1 Tax=Actibacterium sp. 188UL27-1 TaxID=2786961 RepID=UPI00195F126D|nr:hypothetical protein [Actibacterium sp. 188UL27-1]
MTKRPFALWRMALLGLAMVTSALVADPAAARQPSEAQKAQIANAVARYDNAVTNGRVREAVGFFPPTLMRVLARDIGTSTKNTRARMINGRLRFGNIIDLSSFTLSTTNARYGVTRAGRPYALLPTKTVFRRSGGEKFTRVSTTVAVLENRRWYLVNVDNRRQRQLFARAYPDFRGISMPRTKR